MALSMPIPACEHSTFAIGRARGGRSPAACRAASGSCSNMDPAWHSRLRAAIGLSETYPGAYGRAVLAFIGRRRRVWTPLVRRFLPAKGARARCRGLRISPSVCPRRRTSPFLVASAAGKTFLANAIALYTVQAGASCLLVGPDRYLDIPASFPDSRRLPLDSVC